MSNLPTILVVVVGGTPAVVTETVFALCVRPLDDDAPSSISTVHVLTTQHGARACERLQAEFKRMAADYPEAAGRIPGVIEVHVPSNAAGEPIEDVRTESDSVLMADEIVRVMRDVTQNAGDSVVHGSIAGGRKTMGYYLGNAMMFFAREHDRLSHVLVSSEAEGCRDFWYPAPDSRVMEGWAGSFDAAEQTVELHTIPFVPLAQFSRAIAPPDSYEELIAGATDAVVGDHRLHVDWEEGETDVAIRAGGHSVTAGAQLMALWVTVLAAARYGKTPIAMELFYQKDTPIRDLFWELYQAFGGSEPILEVHDWKPTEADDVNARMSKELLRKYFSNIKSTAAELHYIFARRLTPHNVGRRNAPAYTVDAEADRIELSPDVDRIARSFLG